jgi:hypothetical protein
MGRSIFNESLATIVTYWGLPQLKGETPITLNFSTAILRQQFPDFPQDGSFQITFVNNQAKGIAVSVWISAQHLFEFLFQYQCPTQIVVDDSIESQGLYTATLCLGDGVGACVEQRGNESGETVLYYDDDFIAPYDLLETQVYQRTVLDTDYFDRLPLIDYAWLSERQMTETDVQGVDDRMLFIMYHSIYAHKGLIFYNGTLESVFKRQPWYRPRYRIAQFKTEPTAQLTAIEQFNADFLKSRFLK